MARKAERRLERRRKRSQRQYRHSRARNLGPYVIHPRYGDRPILSDERWTEAEIRRAFWRYGSQRIFPETAIKANIARQKYGYSPRRVYVDVEKRCRSCGRKFLFFALEQQYWFEVLQFFVDADCVHCQDCRHLTHLFRQKIAEYEALLARPGKTVAQWDRLSTLADALYHEGYIKKPETLLKSRMPRRLRRSL